MSGEESSSSSATTSIRSNNTSFAANVNDTDPVFSSNRITIPSSTLPIQATPSGNWETDKPQLSSLSSLPDDTAQLLDKEELFDPTIHLPYAPKDWKGYEPATPLSDFLMQRIGVAGRPITTAEYMRHALTHPNFGYYTNPPKSRSEKGGSDNYDDFDVDEWDKVDGITSTNTSTLIGPRGDFVTAPEVSHVFGHCICVWFVTQWKSTLLNSPQRVQLVELGPGRGTLMTDILQLATTSKLQDFGQAIQVVNLIEASRELRSQQEQALQDALGYLIDFEFVQVTSFESMSNTTNKNKPSKADKPKSSSSTEGKKKFQIRVEWHDTFYSFHRQRNKDLPVFMVLQEFLDALPVHSFQKTSEGWRERLIDVASVEDQEDSNSSEQSSPSSSKDPPKLIPRLRQVLAPDVTPAVELFLEPNRQYDSAPEGSVVEICPEAVVLIQDMAKVLEESQGVALMIDYGQDGTADTLRAFSKHRQVPLTSYPGRVDVTADVDFFALRNSVVANKETTQDRQIHAFGPVTQGEFLMRMGAADMVINSIEQDDTTPEQAQRLTDALKYLVLPENMGERYKVLALAPKRDGIFAPAGMEA